MVVAVAPKQAKLLSHRMSSLSSARLPSQLVHWVAQMVHEQR